MHIHIHHTKSVPFPPVICPAIRPTGSRGLLSEWGVPDPLSVRNTSLNPDALTRLHSAWKAKRLFQLGPACLAAIDFVTMGKSSVKSRSKSLRESFNCFFFLASPEIKGYSGFCSVLLSSVLSWVMGLEAEATQWGEPVTNPQPKHFEDLVFKNFHSYLCIHLQYSMFLLPECQVLLLCGIWWRFTDMHNVFLVSVLWCTRIWQHLSCLDAYKRTHGLTHLVSIILCCAWFLLWKGHTLRQVTWGDSQQLSTEGESEEKSKCDAILKHSCQSKYHNFTYQNWNPNFLDSLYLTATQYYYLSDNLIKRFAQKTEAQW